MNSIFTTESGVARVSQYAIFPLVYNEKTPAIKGWRSVKPGQYQPEGNYGIALSAEDIVLDADPRNYPAGRDVLAQMMRDFHFPLTRVVKTPRGGYHFYFKKSPATKYRQKQHLFPGIDFQSEGAYVVGPGSQTSAGEYVLIADYSVAECPESLLHVLEPYAERLTAVGEVTLLHKDQFKAECETVEPGLDAQRFKMALRGRDLGLPSDVVYELMRDYYNPRCVPVMTDFEILTKVNNAYKSARNPLGAKSAEATFTPEMARNETEQPSKIISLKERQDKAAWALPETLTLDKKGNPENTLRNIVYLLKHDMAWRNRFIFNQFSGGIEFTVRPPWRERQLNEGVSINDSDVAHIQLWFSNQGMNVSKINLESALYTAPAPVHPVREYLDSLKWDGIERLDRILIDTAGARDTAFIRAAGRCTLLSAVQRIYEPGSKHDHVLVLEGRQGTGKSTWISVLGGEWYSASELVRGDKDTYQNMRGRWFVELPEINSTFGKADFAWLKSVISTATDVYRASFGRTSRAVPRESVFIGSINPNASKSYLKDDENRRYWPVVTRGFDLEFLRKNRDQYFAEAVHRYKAGEATYLTDRASMKEARAEQAERREVDPWVDALRGFAQATEQFDLLQICAVLGIQVKDIRSNTRERIYSVMRELNCVFERLPTGGGHWRKMTFEDLM